MNLYCFCLILFIIEPSQHLISFIIVRHISAVQSFIPIVEFNKSKMTERAILNILLGHKENSNEKLQL